MSWIYKQRRIGKWGKRFWLYKIRTLKDLPGPLSTSENDPRITTAGRFLRKYKLDEIPNIYNLIRGDLALVGPRATVQSVLDSASDADRRIICSVKPGIVDCASLWDSNEEERLKESADPHKKFMEEIYPEIVKKQIECISHRSLGHDATLVMRTLWRIIKR